MADILRISRDGQTLINVPLSANTKVINAISGVRYDLVDANGYPVKNYTAKMVNGNLVIDSANHPASPDIIIEGYAQFATEPVKAAETVAPQVMAPEPMPQSVAPAPQTAMVMQPATQTIASAPVAAQTASDTTVLGSHAANKAANPMTNKILGDGFEGGWGTWAGAALGIVALGGLAAAVGGGGGSKGNGDDAVQVPDNSPFSPNSMQTNQKADATVLKTVHDYLHGNKIVLPKAYTKAVLAQKITAKSIAEIDAAAKGGMEMNEYISSAEDAKVIISDVNNLSREIQLELSHFVAGLINPIRRAWGVGQYRVSEGALDFAQAVGNEYTDNHKSIAVLNGHYVDGIKRAAEKFGLNANNNFYENLGGNESSGFTGTYTLDDLKRNLYETIEAMLFHDAASHQAHAQSLLNVTGYANQDVQVDYIGVDTSSIVKNAFDFHIIATANSPTYIRDASKFDKTLVGYDTNIVHDTSASTHSVNQPTSSHAPTRLNANSLAFNFSELLDNTVIRAKNFNAKQDLLVLKGSTFSALSSDLSNLDEHIMYDAKTGLLSYDSDGAAGAIAPVNFALLPTGLNGAEFQYQIV